VRVDEGARAAVREPGPDGDAGAPGFLADEVGQFLDDRVQALVGRGRARRTGEREVLVSQVLEALGLL